MTRFAGLADVPPLHALIESAYRGDSATKGWTHESYLLGGQRTDEDSLAAIIADPASRMIVVDRDGAVEGCVHISDSGGGTAYLGMLAVNPLAQAGGTGSRLIEAAERDAAQLFGATRIEMTVIGRRHELISYYERRGYQQTGETRPFPYDDIRFGIAQSRDLDFVVLAKVLL
jgi:GNAT superfamily N-acetyltransferase